MKKETVMEPDRQTLFPYLLFDREIAYNEQITLYPVKMKDVVAFQQLLPALILRKDYIFREKQIIKALPDAAAAVLLRLSSFPVRIGLRQKRGNYTL